MTAPTTKELLATPEGQAGMGELLKAAAEVKSAALKHKRQVWEAAPEFMRHTAAHAKEIKPASMGDDLEERIRRALPFKDAGNRKLRDAGPAAVAPESRDGGAAAPADAAVAKGAARAAAAEKIALASALEQYGRAIAHFHYFEARGDDMVLRSCLPEGNDETGGDGGHTGAAAPPGARPRPRIVAFPTAEPRGSLPGDDGDGPRLYAVMACPEVGGAPPNPPVPAVVRSRELLAACYANAASVALRLGRHRDAEYAATQALALRPGGCAKSWYRRALARVSAGTSASLGLAVEDLKRAAAAAPGDAQVATALAVHGAELRRQDMKDRTTFGGLFDRARGPLYDVAAAGAAGVGDAPDPPQLPPSLDQSGATPPLSDSVSSQRRTRALTGEALRKATAMGLDVSDARVRGVFERMAVLEERHDARVAAGEVDGPGKVDPTGWRAYFDKSRWLSVPTAVKLFLGVNFGWQAWRLLVQPALADTWGNGAPSSVPYNDDDL